MARYWAILLLPPLRNAGRRRRRENLASNLLATGLQLNSQEMADITSLERNGRMVNPEGLAPAWDL
jgi:diketogulonate reductase-like aldo/keto reductase